MGNYDEFSETSRSSMLASIRSSIILIAGVGLFILLVFIFINMVTSWSQNFGQNTSQNSSVSSVE
ncbi:hypothetical protein CO058_02495 [candidate division WWE3 bacterium CG_4_9_14_0_2_um_filter_35_11]|uniref:Uncharacterized protein n=1 Tax=candidate division WWE3 bacterium CG_4_9_14_0_2_um_filter_35_11 TaxID=1975077 RepID=A0A2M8ELI4_UNCKA|nr:MAG: hypothetical protein COV25_02755 [candidate division WWE3 bacterium CG10_big_fil_rev_8_21_14_0_10_35_32]PJC23604.1 MAG: hypothetical protein CO058_02495 [candidate division WWE3 bacterium CG_4_9_14_0_2_um_filter_35_11]